MTLSERSVKKPTTVVMIFILLIAFGVYAMLSLPIDRFPEMDLPYILVSTTYSNAGPEEVETSVTRTLESSLSGVSGLKKLTSSSSSGSSMIILEMNYGTDLDAATGDIRDKIDLVRNYLPTEAKAPVMFKMNPSMMPIMMLSIDGNRSPEELRKYAEDVVQKRLEQIDGVASAYIIGGREKCIRVDVPRDRLEAYSLTISGIAQLIGAQNIQSAGGTIKSGEINYTIQSAGKYKNLEDIRNTVISWKVSAPDASGIPVVRTVKLRDIADVYEGYKEETSLAFMDGQPCVMMLIQKQSGKNSVAAANAVRKNLPKIIANLPNDVKIGEVFNTTDDIEATIHAVVESVIEGALLAILVLFVFLRSFKSTFIIGLTIPISLMVTIVLMNLRGMTLNMISLAGLLIGVGMLVDNAIVILENIYTYRQRDAKPEVAAILGSQEMISAITSSTLTTVCIFLPLILLKSKMGMVGQLFDDLSFTIIFSLLCSLIVAIVLVPVLASKYLVIDNVGHKRDSSRSGVLNRAFSNFFDSMDTGYSKFVRKVLHHKKLTIFIILVLFVVSMFGLVKNGYVFMPETASTNVSVKFTMPKGTRIEVTEAVMHEFESIVRQELKGIKNVTLSVGGSGMMSSASDTNVGTMRIRLYEEKLREPGWDDESTAKDKLRPYFTKFPGADIAFDSGQGGMGNAGLVVEVRTDDLTLLGTTAKKLVDVIKLHASDYVNEVSTDWEDGLPEVKITFDRERMYNMGLNIATVGNEIKANISGTTASRYEDHGDEIDIVVQLSDEDKAKLNDLDNIFATNSNGQRIPLSSFASYEQAEAPVTIRRANQARIAKVTIKQKPKVSLDEVQGKINEIIKNNIPSDENLTIGFSGDNEDFKENAKNFMIVIIMAAALVFAVMASQFESFKDPFIVLFTIPLSFIGVSVIHIMTKTQLNMISILGCLMLVGMIVNNGIVLVDYTNLLRKRGYNLEEACVESARSRLRPILMSTLTTIISLIPMAFFPSEGTEIIQPISLTVLGGLSFGSCMTLVMMPVLYFIFNSAKERKEARRQRRLERKQKRLEAKAMRGDM